MPQTISYQGYHIHASVSGQGETLVFLHGWPTNSNLWKGQVEALKSDYRIITFDWLGFGKSDKPLNHHYTFTRKKEILHTVLSELLGKDEKVTLIAHDIGGPGAILWACEHEARVKRLILLNTVLYTLKTPTDAMSEVILSLPLLKDLFVSPAGLKLILQTNTKSGDKGIKGRIEEVLEAYKHADSHLKQKTIHEPMSEGRKHELLSLSQKYKSLNVEKHLIMAKKDPLCYAHIKKLSEENPDVPRHYIENCGHYMPIDRPRELTEKLRECLRM